MLCGNLHDRLEAELIELRDAVPRALVVGLVDGEYDRHARAAQLGGDFLIASHETLTAIHKKDQQIGACDCALPLPDDELVKWILAGAVQPAGIEHIEGGLAPRDRPREGIPRRAGCGRDDRAA